MILRDTWLLRTLVEKEKSWLGERTGSRMKTGHRKGNQKRMSQRVPLRNHDREKKHTTHTTAEN